MNYTLAVVVASVSLGIQQPLFANDTFQVLVEGMTITWGADTFGYLQVQDAGNWQTLCESNVYTLQDTLSGNREGTACDVEAGIYNVINHTTRQRIHGLAVGGLDGVYTAPNVETIDDSWVYYDPYRVIDANDVYSATPTVPAPANLSVVVYSSTAAELFWDRADVPGLQYNAYLGDQLLGSTNGTSLFLSQLNPGKTIDIRVVARNSLGKQSDAIHVNLQTPNDGSHSAKPTELMTPTGLRASVYSANTLELFWDRQGPGQLFDVFDQQGELLVRTDGVSYFASQLPMRDEYQFSVRTVDPYSNSSEPASIVVSINDSGGEPAISISNAENLLSQVVVIANRVPFEQTTDLMAPSVAAVVSSGISFVAGDVPPANGLTLIEGTAGGPDTVDFAGRNGGQYLCVGGGTAQALSVLGGENSQGYIVSLDQCVLATGQYSGTVTYADGGRSGYVTNNHENLDIIPATESTTYRYDGSERFVYNRYIGDYSDSLTVDTYSERASDSNKLIEITNYQSSYNSQLKMDQGSFLDILFGEFSANITFDAQLPSLSSSLYSVFIDLGYRYDESAQNPAGFWNSGMLAITAADGSQLMATLLDTDNDSIFDSLSIVVDDNEIVRAISDGYRVSCRQNTLAECN